MIAKPPPLDVLIVPPPDVLGVWCDVRGLEDYPEDGRPRRGPLPRAVVASQQVMLTWFARGCLLDASTLASLRAARKQILAFSRQAEVLGARRAKRVPRPPVRERLPRVPVSSATLPQWKRAPELDIALESGAQLQAHIAPVPAPVVVPPVVVPPASPAPAAVPEQPVPQDDFMAALATVFG